MPRRARVTLAGVPHHIIQRGNNRSACFYMDEDYENYLRWLEEYSYEYACQVHAYVLMTNHTHLLVTPKEPDGLANLMKRLGQRYVQSINRQYNRSGTLWEGRFKSCIVNEEKYLLGCYRYIELNPVRARMVEHPGSYPWTSYRANAQCEVSSLLTPHNVYTRLGSSKAARARCYRELFKISMPSKLIDEIRRSTNGNYALGSDVFRKEVAAMIGRRASPGKPGRPRQTTG